MKLIAIEISGNSAGILRLNRDKNTFDVINLGKKLSIPEKSDSIKDILEFQTNFSMYFQDEKTDLVVLVEGGNGSNKKRIRMEFAILSECERQCVKYETYPTNSCTFLINKDEKETGRKFSDELKKFGVPKYMENIFIAGRRFIK